MKSKRVVVIVAVAAVCIGGLLWLVNKPGGSGGIVGSIKTVVSEGKEAIERWAGEQLLAIANDHLNPTLAFSKLRFELPATVYLENVTLTSEGTQIVRAREMRIEFREAPRVGQPVVIQTVAMTDPVIRLIETPQGNLLGFADLTKSGEGSRTADGGSTKLSDVFVIRRLAVGNGTVHYEPRNEPAMYLDQMSFELMGKPASQTAAADSGGWYDMDVKLVRAPVLDWTTNARLNIDTAALDFRTSVLRMSLKADQYEVLPPPLQAIVRKHEITGDYLVTATGLLLMDDTAASDLHIDHKLTGGHMALGEYQLPLDSLEVNTHMRSGVLNINPIAASLLGGTLNMSGTLALRKPHALDFKFDVQNVRIEQALRPVSAEPPRYSGNFSCHGDMAGEASEIRDTFQCDSRLNVSEARLVNLKVLGKLVRELGGNTAESAPNDYGSADLNLNGTRALFTNIEVVSGAIAARGEGTINYDSTVNFRINAGPLERLQGAMGKIGELFGKVTDKIVWYEVTGTVEEPVVKVKPLGL